jgi:hypothetical protein
VSRAAVAILLSTSCAIPVVSAGNYLPAGDLQPGDVHASISMEAARVLAGPSDTLPIGLSQTARGTAIPAQAQQWEVSTWFASDVTLRWQALRRLTLEAQLKLTNPITPFTPQAVGGSLGARLRILEHPPEGGFAAEVGLRVVGITAEQRLDRSQDGVSQTDFWDYRAAGVEAPLVVTYRINSLVAVTGSPFLRLYMIRAWHTEETPTTRQQNALFWTPVLSGGFATSFAFDLGILELAPGLAIELATTPGPAAPTHVLFEPGISVGLRL